MINLVQNKVKLCIIFVSQIFFELMLIFCTNSKRLYLLFIKKSNHLVSFTSVIGFSYFRVAVTSMWLVPKYVAVTDWSVSIFLKIFFFFSNYIHLLQHLHLSFFYTSCWLPQLVKHNAWAVTTYFDPLCLSNFSFVRCPY